MKKFKQIKKRFLREIEKNKICISKNPKGTDIVWPKSYSELYYKDSLCKIYNQNKSPVIIQINESNKIINNLWNSFFKSPIIKDEIISTSQSFEIFIESYKDFLFDVVIIKNYKNIEDIYYVINFLKSKLKKNGVIIIENINFDFKLITKLFFQHSCKICDFRFKRFLIDNCIIEIKRYSSNKKRILIIKYLPRYIFHLVVELTYYYLYIFKELAN